MATIAMKAPTWSAPLKPSVRLVSALPRIAIVSTTNITPSTIAAHFSNVWIAS